MLSLSGNSEQAFASLNSINANPQVWMEWNYNEFIKPYVVYPSITDPINSASLLKDPENWGKLNGGRVYSYDSVGYQRETDSDTTCLVLETVNSYSDSFSSSFTVPSKGYYKMLFLVKSESANVYETSEGISGLTVRPNATGATSTYYYRVIPRSKSFYQPLFDSTGADEVSVNLNQASATLRWYAEPSKVFSYDIYRRISGETTSKYLTTIPADSKSRTISIDSGMTHFEGSDNWKTTATVTCGSGSPTNPSTIIKKSRGGGNFTSGFKVINNNKSVTKPTVGAVGVELKSNVSSAKIYNSAYTASISNINLNMFKTYDDGGDNTRFGISSDLALVNGQSYTFAATVKNPMSSITKLGGGKVTVSVLVYSDAAGTNLLDTISASVLASAIESAWTTIPVTFTASAGRYISFRINNDETYNLGTIATVKKGNSPVVKYPIAIDAVGLWAGTSAKTWTEPDKSNIFYRIQTEGVETYRYVDDTLTDPQSIAAPEFESTNFYISPIVRLYNGAGSNYLESTKFFCRVLDDESNMPIKVSNSIQIDGTKYSMVEVFFGSEDDFDAVEIDLNVTAPTQGARFIMSKPEVVKMDSWNFSFWEYSPIESPFYSNRPGESLLHPYLPDADKTISLPKTGETLFKQSTNIFYSANFAMNIGYPYRQMYFSKYNKFKYYLSPYNPSIAATVIRAQYANYLDINKIIVKSTRAIVNMKSTSGSVVILGPNNTTLDTVAWSTNDFNDNGILSLYYNGASWSTSRGNWEPPKLTDSGILQNVSSSVTGLIFIHNSSVPVSSRDNQDIFAGFSPEIRTHVIEISPRLEIDISDLISSVSISKSIDDQDSVAGFPIGYMNANTGSLDINNIPVYRNSFPHTIFDNISENSTFSDLLRQNVKFTVGLVSPSLDFTDYVPFMTMYSESWNINGLDKVTVNLFDTAKGRLMATEAPDYLSWGEGIFDTITNLLEVSGITDYDIDSLRNITYDNSRASSYFWCDKKDNIFDVLKKIFVAYQIGASYDEYGVLRFIDLGSVLSRYTSSNFAPDFAVTDVPLTIETSNKTITYESNIIQGSYSPTIGSKVGKIIVQYRIPNQQTSVNVTGDIQTVEKAVYQENVNLGLASTWLKNTLMSGDTAFNLGNTIKIEGGPNSLSGYSGYGFIGGELISWRGMQHTFSSTQINDTDGQQINKVLFNSDEIQKTMNDMLSANTSIKQIYHSANGRVVGVSRGQKFTSIRNHYVYHDSEISSEWPSSVKSYDNTLSQYFSLRQITAKGTSGSAVLPRTNTVRKINFQSNVAKFSISTVTTADNPPAVLVAESGIVNKGEPQIPSSASNFNYFSIAFTAQDFRKVKFAPSSPSRAEIGFYVDHKDSPLLVGLRNYNNGTRIVSNSMSTSTIVQKDAPNVFDGQSHRFTAYFIGGRVRIWIDKSFIGAFEIQQAGTKANFDMARALKWGVYADNLSKNAAIKPVEFSVNEIYAVGDTRQDPYLEDGLGLDPNTGNCHHWQTSNFLKLLLMGYANAEPNYYFWGSKGSGGGPVLTGAHFYENQEMNTGPAQPASLISIYSGYNPATEPGKEKTLAKVVPSDITMSPVVASPFRFSSAYVNNSNQLVFLSSNDNKVGNGSISNVQINGVTYTLSDAITTEKIISSANLSNTTTLTTDWIQSTQQAENLINTAAKLTNSFNTEINIDLFGNPLIQVGDICQFVYTLKKIGYDPDNGGVIPRFFFVKSVKQDFSSGLKTTVSIRPLFEMSYTDIP